MDKRGGAETGRVYGPVPSRRLGFSLGVDIVPFKVCSFDCIYCQLGPTHGTTVDTGDFFDPAEISGQIESVLDSGRRVDYITFSGSGEPTLNSRIGDMIEAIKKTTSVPVAVLTNSSLLPRSEVRSRLASADLVVPSLDAATQDVFLKVNRPHSMLQVEDIIEGLAAFRKEFPGKIWLEIMLVKGVNDSPAHVLKLKEAAELIRPDKIQLNTVIRPPAVGSSLPLDHAALEAVRAVFQGECEIVADVLEDEQDLPSVDLEADILAMIKRRPVTVDDISRSLGRHRDEVVKCLDSLSHRGVVRAVRRKKTFYEIIIP